MSVCEQVYRHLYADGFPLLFSMGEAVNETEIDPSLLSFQELNSREDYEGLFYVTTAPLITMIHLLSQHTGLQGN